MVCELTRREWLGASGIALIACAAPAMPVAAAPLVDSQADHKRGQVVRLYMGQPELVAAGQDAPYRPVTPCQCPDADAAPWWTY